MACHAILEKKTMFMMKNRNRYSNPLHVASFHKVGSRAVCSILVFFILIFSASVLHADSSGKKELTAGQSINGIYIAGAYLYGLGTESYHRQLVLPGGITGGLIGFSTTVELVDKDDMSHQRAYAINSISFWSSLEGYLLAWIAGADHQNRMLFSSMVNGLMTGYAFYTTNRYETTSDDIALMNFTGLWGTVLLIELAKFINPKSTGMAKYVTFTFVTGSLIAAFYSARQYELDARRAGTMSLYGILGAFSGAGVAWVMYFKSERLYYLSMFLGTAAGLYLGYYLTDKDRPENEEPFQKRQPGKSSLNYRFTIGRYAW